MQVQFVYNSQNPSCDSLTVWLGHERIAAIDQENLMELLTDSQRKAWGDGQATFRVKASELRVYSSKSYTRF